MSNSIFPTDEEVEKLLSHEKNGLVRAGVEVKIIGKGNHGNGGLGEPGQNRPANRSLESKADISVLANLIGVKATSEILDVSPAVVSKKKNGKTSSDAPDPELVIERDKRLGIVSEKALDRVDILLDVISEEKMNGLSVKDAAVTAEKMVNVFDKLKKKDPREMGNDGRPSVVFYAPRQVTLNDYRIQEVE